MSKKLRAMILASALVMASFFTMPTAATGEGIFLNGDFSQVANSINNPSEWEMGSGEENWMNIKVDKSGENPFLTLTLANRYVTSPYVEVKGGETYVLSFRMRTGTENHRMFWYSYDENKTQIGSDGSIYMYATNGAWRTFVLSYTAPEGASYMRIKLNNHSSKAVSDTVYYHYDDFVMQKGSFVFGNRIENGGFENEGSGLPTDIQVSTTGEGAATIEKTTVHDGENALKLSGTNAEDSVTVSIPFPAAFGTPYYDISAFVNSKNFESASVKIEVYEYNSLAVTNRKLTTEAFTNKEDKWRKILLRYTPSASANLELRITFSGIGSVYLDDVAAIGTDEMVVNSDLEGMKSDAQAIHAFNNSFGTDTTPFTLCCDADGNQYLRIQGQTWAQKLTFTFEKGAKYILSFDYRSWQINPQGGAKEASDYGAKVGYCGSGQATLPGTLEWRKMTIYFEGSGTSSEIIFTLRATGDYQNCAEYDNISIKKADGAESIGVYNAQGNKISKLTPGETVTAKYNGYGTDYATGNNKNVLLITGLYAVDETGNVKLVKVALSEGKAPAGIYLTTNTLCTASVAGEPPLTLSSSIQVPNDGQTYQIRLLCVDGLRTLHTYMESVMVQS